MRSFGVRFVSVYASVHTFDSLIDTLGQKQSATPLPLVCHTKNTTKSAVHSQTLRIVTV